MPLTKYKVEFFVRYFELEKEFGINPIKKFSLKMTKLFLDDINRTGVSYKIK